MGVHLGGSGSHRPSLAADWKDIVVKRILALLAVMAAWFVIAVPVAQAAAIEISLDTVVTADEGSVTVLASADTPAEIIGLACVGVARAENQPSVHPDNDLIVTSGGDSIILEDVERTPGAVTTAEGLLTLGQTVTVSLRMGPDEFFSGGMVFTVEDCAPPTTTTTTTTEPPGGSTTTTTTEPPGGTTTTTQASGPAIVIEKTADPVDYGDDGIGDFVIRVSNPGPVDLTNVRVTDDIAVAIDPDSDCPNPDVPDLAVGEFFEYRCSVGNLDGVSPFRNEATALGVGSRRHGGHRHGRRHGAATRERDHHHPAPDIDPAPGEHDAIDAAQHRCAVRTGARLQRGGIRLLRLRHGPPRSGGVDRASTDRRRCVVRLRPQAGRDHVLHPTAAPRPERLNRGSPRWRTRP